jgi:hypothetical protein
MADARTSSMIVSRINYHLIFAVSLLVVSSCPTAYACLSSERKGGFVSCLIFVHWMEINAADRRCAEVEQDSLQASQVSLTGVILTAV